MENITDEFKGTGIRWRRGGKKYGNPDGDVYWTEIVDEDGRAVAEAKGKHYGISNVECDHNTDVLAASLDMLEALMIVRKIDSMEKLNTLSDYIEKVINKALGI